jgi:hypothetical protein
LAEPLSCHGGSIFVSTRGVAVKRFAWLIAAGGAVAVCVVALAGGVTTATGASTLPTITLALQGSKAITVSGTPMSGAVNVVSTFTGKGQGQVALVRVNPATSPQQGFQAVQSHNGDLNALTPLGDAVVFDVGAPSTAQTVLMPGTYIALNLTGNGQPPHAAFVVAQSAAPAALPKPGATIRALEFNFRGASTLHSGELVRFENDGFLVHMIAGTGVKNRAVAAAETAALRAGKDTVARRLASGFADFAGPLSPGGLQQEVIQAKPGIYVLACFMDTQDGREHTQLGMERTIRIVK